MANHPNRNRPLSDLVTWHKGLDGTEMTVRYADEIIGTLRRRGSAWRLFGHAASAHPVAGDMPAEMFAGGFAMPVQRHAARALPKKLSAAAQTQPWPTLLAAICAITGRNADDLPQWESARIRKYSR